jgi:PAS domain S-box-containing protein
MTGSTGLESAAEIETFIAEYYAAWGGTDEDRIMSYYADNVTVQIPGTLMQGKAALLDQFVRPFITGFPGNRHVVKKIVSGPDAVVVVEFTFEAEHKGPFAGRAATDARVALSGCGVYEVDPGKRQITSARIYFDVGTLLKQILDQRHPHVSPEEAAAAPTGTISAPVEHLDLATVLAVLQTVSGEMVLEKLLDTLMRTAVQHARAERALLILSRAAEHRIAAEATASNETVTARLSDEPVNGSMLPETVFRYVLLTRESVVLDDAAIVNPFSGDPYIAQRHARSVLCVPLTNQAKLIGALYFENNLAPCVFAPARIAVLKLLASQAAISIENSRLYRDLAERESRIGRMIDANIIGSFSWHADGRVLDANGEFVRIIGHSRDDLVSGRVRWTDFTLAEWRERDAREMEVLRAGGVSQPQERELLRKDGTRVPVMTGGTMFEGSTDEGVAFVFDWTERKRVEQALRESERASRMIVNSIPGLVATLTPAGEVEAVNEQVLAYTGRTLEVLKQWGTNDTVHPDDLPRAIETVSDAMKSGEPYEIVERIRRFDAVYRWFQVRGLPLRDSNERIARWYVLLTDIDDLKRAEAENSRLYRELSERESRIRRLVDANIIGIFIWEREGRILEANDAFLRMVGYDREDLAAGRLRWTDLTAPEWRDRDYRRWMPELQPFEKEYVRKDGTRLPVLIGVAAFEDTDDRGVAYVLDLTERKQAQDALTRAGAELARVSRATAMSALTASIAHEVNQPLSGIITNASTCLRWLDTIPPNIEGARETARRTIRDGKRAAEVIGRLRALFTKREFTLEPLDLNEATREVIAVSSNDFQRHRIILQSELADDLPVVTGDRIQLQQVILNLVRNASEASVDVHDRPRALLLKTERNGDDGVRLSIRDAGVGLSPQTLTSLFDAFYTTKLGGMGVGLFVSRSIIERHHGRLWAEPNEGAPGATFSFSIPCGGEGGLDTA